jgi:hypothetical protein
MQDMSSYDTLIASELLYSIFDDMEYAYASFMNMHSVRYSTHETSLT